MSYEISRRYEFAAAHRIKGHPKCGRMHGHNYVVEVVLGCTDLPKDGMLMDYGKLDEIVKPIINKLDHRYLLSNGEMGIDYDLETIDMDTVEINVEHSTAELLAYSIYQGIRYQTGLVQEVSIWETSKSKATYRP